MASSIASPGFVSRVVEHSKAGFAGLHVRTPETFRAEFLLMKAAEKLSYGYARWSLTTGWTKDPKASGEPADPLASILKIRDEPNGQIFAFLAFPELWNDPSVRQGFRDVLIHAKANKKTVVLLGTFDLPLDLQKEFTSIEFDLPSREELSGLAAALIKSNGLEMPPEEEISKTVEAALGLTAAEAENAMALSLVRFRKMNPVAVLETKKAIVKAAGMLEFLDTTETLEDIGGLEVAKEWAAMRRLGFSTKARAFGIRAPRGCLLIGVPGCGKSLFAKALSKSWGIPCLRLDMGRLFGGLVGQSEAQARAAIGLAEAMAPCILFIDEMDKALAGMGAGGSGDSGTTQRVGAFILSWLQDRTAPVFVVATANNVSAMPPEWLRKGGRWDEIWAIDLPSDEERAAIAAVHLRKMGRGALAVKDNLRRIAERTRNFTGSEIEECVRSALWSAFADGEREVTVSDVLTAAAETTPLSVTAKESMDRLREWANGRARWASAKPKKGTGRGDDRVLDLN